MYSAYECSRFKMPLKKSRLYTRDAYDRPARLPAIATATERVEVKSFTIEWSRISVEAHIAAMRRYSSAKSRQRSGRYNSFDGTYDFQPQCADCDSFSNIPIEAIFRPTEWRIGHA
jgi:hypothetical protein